MDLFYIHLIGGLIVITSYIYYLPKISSERLWSGIPKEYRKYFLISIMIAMISFIMGMWSKNDWKLNIGFMIFYIGASLWTPSVYYNNKEMVFMSLCITTLGALILSLFSPRYMLFLIVLLHCLIMDNIIWYKYYINY